MGRALALVGYGELRLLRSRGHTRVYEATRRRDDRAVVAKVFELGHDEVEARVEHELALIEALEVEGVVRAIDLRRVGDQLVLLLERAPGVDLASYAEGRPLELERFFDIAIALADILAEVHGQRVIHRDIKPTNILVDPATGAVHLADFGISVLLERERRQVHDPELIAGTLPYLSPEQTGRTKRAVDFRSDLYSLGVTFYELLAGRRPFEQLEPLELIHAHLARKPEPIQRWRPELPAGLDHLVAKLLAKAPEHRYQTARGLAADLRALRAALARGEDGAELELGREDVADELRLPHELHGRERERAFLDDTFARVRGGQDPRMVVVVGPAGIGKSALLDAFGEGLAPGSCTYARGRFESSRLRPYSAIVEAFEGIADQLLTASEAELERRRAQLSRALGGIGQVIVDLAPRLEAVLGPQPPLAALDPRSARNRLQLAVARFLSVFCGPGHPLVLSLEDLQWADESSIELLAALLRDGVGGPALILTSLRDPEEAAPLDLFAVLEPLPEAQVEVDRLGPLPPRAVETLLVDTLGRPARELEPLTRLVVRKTGRNPLFIRQLLLHLVEIGLLRAGTAGWVWDPAALDQASVPDDVLAVMVHKLAALRPELAELSRRAACIGDRFSLSTLERVADRPSAELVPAVYELVELGLVDRVGEGFRFAHHGVREVALQQVDPEEVRRIRWTIGRHLLASGAPANTMARFELIEHLDAGLDASRLAALGEGERVELARLYADAGGRALASAALEVARRYLERGLELVDFALDEAAAEGPAAPHQALIFELQFSRAEALALAGAEGAEGAFEALLAWRLSAGQRAKVAAAWITQLNLVGRSAEAVELGLELMARWGCHVSRQGLGLRLRLSLRRATAHMLELDSPALLALPACEDERAAAVMTVLDATKTATYVLDPRLYILLIVAHVRWFLDHGLHASVPLTIAQLAVSVGGFHRVDEAAQLCELALALSERFPDGPARVRTACAAQLFVAHRVRPFAEPLAELETLYPRAREQGDLVWAGYAGSLLVSMHLEVGTHLSVLRRRCEAFERGFGARASTEAKTVVASIAGLAQLLGAGGERAQAPAPAETQTLADARAALDPAVQREAGASRYSICVAAANGALLELLLGNPAAALGHCLEIFEDMEAVLFTSWVIPRVALTLLVAAAGVEGAGGADPVRARDKARARRIIAEWAEGSWDNYGHYHALAEGLRALEGRPKLRPACEAFERARSLAAERGCRWVEGLAAEALADVAAGQGLTGFAEGAGRQAWDAYEAWGARGKLAQLRVVGVELGSAPADASGSGPRWSTASSSTGRGVPGTGGSSESSSASRALDFDSVLHSVAAIASDLRLDQVIANVLDATLTNAGADRGLLVLGQDGAFGIVARADLDEGLHSYAEPLPLREAGGRAPTSLIHFVLRTGQALVVDEAPADERFADDPYVRDSGVRSLLGMPITLGARTLGVLVLENRSSGGCFTSERFEALALIAAQAARAIEHARIHGVLRESEARWRSLVDGAPDLVALFDAEGELEFVNRARSEGVDHERLLRRFAAAPGSSWSSALAEVLDTGALRDLELELPADEAGAPSSWFVARLAPIELSEGLDGGLDLDGSLGDSESRKAIVIATDVSARKQAEAEARDLEAQLRQQQRLESVGTLASGVAHEINNPIQGIMNYAELIAGNVEDHALVGEFAGEIQAESERVATIVRNLLAFSRQEQQQPVGEVEVRTLVEATLSLLRAVMRKDRIDLRVELDDPLPPVRCRPQQIQQILMNLVTNARDALNTACPEAEEPRPIHIRAHRHRDEDGRSWLRLSVEDQGPGIPPQVLPRIFDPFFTTKGRDQGTGLGLAVSHGIAREHGGELSVDSRPGEGARFHLDLPLDLPLDLEA